MRLTKERVHHIATTVIKRLGDQGLLTLTGSAEGLVRSVETAMTEELTVEDRLNAEVRELLKKFDTEFSQGRADYQKMFTMVKHKLVRERGLVL